MNFRRAGQIAMMLISLSRRCSPSGTSLSHPKLDDATSEPAPAREKPRPLLGKPRGLQ
jgi:hypothetical protein